MTQQVTAQISEKTGHLPGVAIAIMGCIVNGVGEMADADFGYVGGAPGKVSIWHTYCLYFEAYGTLEYIIHVTVCVLVFGWHAGRE